MGARLARFSFTSRESEHIETEIRVPEENRSVIHGVVKDPDDKILRNAVVKLFEVENPCNPCSLTPVSYTFTDEDGEFLFGPLSPHKHYVIKVWFNEVKMNHIFIGQDGCETECGEKNEEPNEKSEGPEIKSDTAREKGSAVSDRSQNPLQGKTRIIPKNQRHP